jgi:hypothetical protein
LSEEKVKEIKAVQQFVAGETPTYGHSSDFEENLDFVQEEPEAQPIEEPLMEDDEPHHINEPIVSSSGATLQKDFVPPQHDWDASR